MAVWLSFNVVCWLLTVQCTTKVNPNWFQEIYRFEYFWEFPGNFEHPSGKTILAVYHKTVSYSNESQETYHSCQSKVVFLFSSSFLYLIFLLLFFLLLFLLRVFLLNRVFPSLFIIIWLLYLFIREHTFTLYSHLNSYVRTEWRNPSLRMCCLFFFPFSLFSFLYLFLP